MDILINIAVLVMLVIASISTTLWIREKFLPTSVHLRSAALMMTCLTLLIFVLFGTRIFIKPEVSISYSDITFDVFNNLTVNDKSQQVLETKKIVGCQVDLRRSYPLMIVMGRDSKTIKYKAPCDALMPEMKTEIANLTSYLKDEK